MSNSTDFSLNLPAELTNLKSLEIFSSKVIDIGIRFLKELQNLALLNLEGCFVTAACLDTLARGRGIIWVGYLLCIFQKWKEIVDEWVRLNQLGRIASLMADGDSSPLKTTQNGHHQTGLIGKSLIEFQSTKGDVLPAHKVTTVRSKLCHRNQSQCLADLCGVLHCDIEINFGLKKPKCNPTAAARNKHLCE
ncbi:hypothetical protein S83_055504, partial [Arachis hypogaea]